ncbi:serine/threonine protein kinase [Paucibacter soli]|uniref:serine/threonine protein kinase n=1 Tax=Paucibacter soli TaxID=3133433 RepID=UPI0030B4B09D
MDQSAADEPTDRVLLLPPQLDEANALPAGTRFAELEIISTLGVGGFGIVYLAQDHALQRRIAIKEYMPAQLVRRDSGSLVTVRAGVLRETFELGRRSFVNEARLLARFDHPALLKVYRFWEANGTAYMAMPYLQGQTLKQARLAMAQRPDEDWLRRVLLALLDGLALLHAEAVVHRDISPDNILLPEGGGDPILLDFGAARQAIEDRSQHLTAILKPSFAPIEQYAEATGLRQGPWTDLYALGAVMHYLLLGHPPPPATARAMVDEYLPLSGAGLVGYSMPLLLCLDWMLRVHPQERPASVAELRAALAGERAAPLPPQPTAPAVHQGMLERGYAPTQQLPEPAVPPPPDLLLDEAPLPEPPPAPTLVPLAPLPVQPPPVGRGKRLALALALTGLAAAAGWNWLPRGATPPVPAPAPASSAAAALITETRDEVGVPVRTDQPPRPAVGASRPPSPRTAARAANAASAPAASSSVSSAAEPPAGPREACGNRSFLALAYCIDRECEKPVFQQHPECLRLRELRENRQRNRQ